MEDKLMQAIVNLMCYNIFICNDSMSKEKRVSNPESLMLDVITIATTSNSNHYKWFNKYLSK